MAFRDKREKKEQKDGRKAFFRRPVSGSLLATNAYNALSAWRSDNNNEKNPIQQPYSVHHTQFVTENTAQDWQYASKGVIKDTISITAAQYYATVDPSTIDDAFDQFVNLVSASNHIYSIVCTLFRTQNARNSIDEKDVDLGLLLNSPYDANLGINDVCLQAGNGNYLIGLSRSKMFGSFGISNSDWANEYLACLDEVYLSDANKAYLESIFINTTKFKVDDGNVGLQVFWPADLFLPDWAPRDWTKKAAWLEILNAYKVILKTAINKYPFLREVCRTLGLKSGSGYDFTRDLKGKTLFMYEDSDGELEAVLYSSYASDYEEQVEEQPIGSLDCVISTPETVTHYTNGEITYDDQLSFNIVSLSILGKGTITPLSTTYVDRTYVISSGISDMTYNLIPYCHDTVFDITNASVTVVRLNAFIRLFTTQTRLGVVTPPLQLTATFGQANAGIKYMQVEPMLGLADYIFNAGDYRFAYSVAATSLIFGVLPDNSGIDNTINTKNSHK